MGGCFPCFGSSNKEASGGVGAVKELNKDSLKEGSAGHHVGRVSSDKSKSLSTDPKKEQSIPKDGPTASIAAQTFTFRELAAATKNFRPECLLGEGGFGRVYKGCIESIGQVVAVKQLDRNGLQGNREFLVEARPLFKDRRKFPKMADPLLQGHYPMRGLYQALAVAAMCLQEQAATRPLIGDVVTALTYLASQTYDPNAANQSNRVGPSTPRNRDDWRGMADGLDSPDEHGRGRRHGSPSTYKNSPDYRKRDHARELSTGAELRSEMGSGSGRKWGLEDSDRQDSQRDSPLSTSRARETTRNRDLDRERAVAEAKVWGENWREKRRANAMGSFDGTNE
ncbi:hypothetical protein SADUNF_Sadunf10G0016500 [Salix dunnii]|uniref:Protein kinase domain-containing protein n=1 Tax=Salix dunnii TaxID=1413687 RepID=A0A835JQE9_9ROSI|nr:hypothetical protein SADUNF_Sadunf10G0016500 [Salix dunnii]